jgi:dephospho-CoA kinase
MLRVGLTGGLGSGKSTAAKMFATLGAHVLQSDGIGRELMEPGQAVYAGIVAHFGDGVVLGDGSLDRRTLARIAFADGRVEELNAIVHPAVIARQVELSEEIFARDARVVVMVESALIFETNYSETNYSETNYSETNYSDAGHGEAKHGEASHSVASLGAVGSGARWSSRFDKIILVTAPEEVKIARFVARSGAGVEMTSARRDELEAEARRRLAQQISDEQKSSLCDYVLSNGGAVTELEWQVDRLWPILQAAAG